MIKRVLIAAWIALTSIILFASPPASALTAQTISFPSPGSQIAGSTFSVSATASSGLPVTFTSSTPTVCTVSGSSVSLSAWYPGTSCTIVASQAGNATYAAAVQVAQSFAITGSTTQTISFAALAGKTYGAAPFTVSTTASSGLTVTITSSTPAVCTVSGSTVTLVSSGTCTIDANQAGNGTYAAAPQVAQSFAVVTSQTINFPALGTVAYTTAPITLTATASSGLPVTLTSVTQSVCTVSGFTLTLVSPGTCQIYATQLGNSNFSAVQIYQLITVTPDSQTITFPAIPNQVYGTAPLTLLATASSGLPVSYYSYTPSVCSLSGSILTLVSAGSCQLLISQGGNADYSSVAVYPTFTVSPANQTINFPALANVNVTGGSQRVNPTASSGLSVTVASNTPSVCTVTQPNVYMNAGGVCTLVANQAGSSNYNAAATATQSFTVSTIYFPALPNVAFSATPVALAATAVSGLPITYSSSTPAVCTVSGSSATLVGLGTCTIVANSIANSQWLAPLPATQSFTVSQGSQTITFPALATQTLGAAPFTVSATASSGLPVTITGNTSVCTVSGLTVTLVGSGQCTLYASQPGNSDYAAASTVSQKFTVIQTISFPQIPNLAYSAINALPLSATASSGLPVTFASSTPSVCWAQGPPLNVGTGPGTGYLYTQGSPGTCTITATQPGQSGVPAAAPVTQSFTILPDSQTISFPALPTSYNGALQSTFGLSATATSRLAVTFSSSTPSVCTVSGATVTMVGVGTCTVAADQAGGSGTQYSGAYYAAAPEVTRSITLIATQTIGFAALPDQPFGVTPPTLTATASSGLPVSFSSLTTNTCTVSGTTVTLLAGGSCSIAANQAGNGSYSAAPQVIQSFAVVLAGQSMTIAPTTTSLTVSENSVAPSQSIVLAATVTGNNPTGTVIFLDGTTVLGSATPTNGQATLATAFGAPGTFGGVGAHSVVAAYAGDSNNATSASAPTTVNVLDLWIALTSPTGGDVYSASAYGIGTIYLSAQLSRASGDDIVTFNVNGQIIAATPGVTAGSYVANASLAPSSTPYSVYATVTQGSTARESSIATFTVGATGTALLTIGTPTVSGNTVNLSANATAVSGAVVQFFANGVAINTNANPATNNSGAWSYTWTNVPTGVYTISAQLVSATGATLAQQTAAGTAIVGAAPGGTALAVSATTVPNNQPMTLTASVFGNNPNGSVTFQDGTTSLGSAGVSNGQATLSPQLSTAGLHSLTARYNGDANNPVSTSAPVFVQSYAVVLQNQTVSFPTIPNQTFTQSGATFTISASTSSGLPITFTYFPNWVCGPNGGACVVVPGVCSVTGNTVTINTTGSCTIIAYSNGDTTYAAASAVQTFTIGATAPTVTMNAPLNGSTFDAPITLATPLANVPISSGIVTAGAGASIVSMTVLVDGSVFGNPITGGSVDIVGMLTVGVHTVQLQATDSTGNTGSSNSASVTVVYGDGQAINFPAPSGTYGPAPFTVSATASSGLPVTFSTTTPAICSVSGTTVTILATGTCIVAADQAGNATYLAAPEVTQSFTVLAPNTTPTPTVTLSVSSSSVTVGSGGTAAVTFTGSGAETGGQIASLALYENNGTTPVWSGSGASLSQTLNLVAGNYMFQLAAVDANGKSATSTQVAVTVSASGSIVKEQDNTQVTVALGASSNYVTITSGITAPVTLNTNITVADGTISSISLLQNSGSGYAPVTLPANNGVVTGQQIYTLNLAAGSYLFMMTATDAYGKVHSSTPVLVNVNSSSLLGQTNGVEVTPAGTPQLFGWACKSGVSTALSYQVYINEPTAALGGTLLTSATYTANVSGQPDDATVQGKCGVTGSSHDFTLDLSSYTSQYGGAPFYVHAWDSSGDSVVLPCSANNCVIPGSLRIGLSSPSPTNTDEYSAPATIFMRAALSGGSTTGADVSFILHSASIPNQPVGATPDTTPGTYYASLHGMVAGTYTVTAMVQQNGANLYSSENVVTVVPSAGYSITLNAPSATTISAGGSVTFSANAPVVEGAIVQFYANGNLINDAVNGAATGSNGVWSYTWNKVPAGVYSVTAHLVSPDGVNLGQSSAQTVTATGTAAGLAPMTQSFASVQPAPPANLLANPDAGTLLGSLGVDQNGAATYSIPIAVPPGTNGMAPQLALNYSSLAGNGIAGYGWSLSVGSSARIHRCVRTIAQDTYAGPINLNSSDALCLDGNRLLLVSGTYGQVNAIYRTELDNFARITQISGLNGQPAFTVETKAGQTMYFGYYPATSAGDSTVQAIGKVSQSGTPVVGAPPLYWDLAATMDRSGNSIQYHYNVQDSVTGEHLLSSISYGTSTNQYNNVTFGYECRNGMPASSNCAGMTTAVGDADIEYLAGARIDMRHRLKTISTYTDISGGVPIQTTTLTYQTSKISQRSLLILAQVCIGSAGTSCLSPTTFDWGGFNTNSIDNFNSNNTFATQGLMPSGPPQDWGNFPAQPGQNGVPSNPGIDYQQVIGSMITGDFLGDGKQRILTAEPGVGWHIYTVNATGSDFEHTDLPYSSYPNLPTQLSFGAPNAAGTYPSLPTMSVTQGPILVGDFDGDGRDDIAFIDIPYTNSTTGVNYSGNFNWNVCLSRMTSTGNGFDCKSFPLDANMYHGIDQLGTGGLTPAQIQYNVQNGLRIITSPSGARSMIAFAGAAFVNTADNVYPSEEYCGFVAPTVPATDNWSWTCNVAHGLDGPFLQSGSTYFGDFLSIGVSAAFSQDDQGGATASNTVGTNSELIVTLLSSPSVTFVAGTSTLSPTYTNATNQFVWSTTNVNQVISRYFVRESHGVEAGGTPVGDLNGDGYDDYLMTFEGHAEICYSNGIDGFLCRLMEDLTPANWQVPTALGAVPGPGKVAMAGAISNEFMLKPLPTGTAVTASLGLTLTPDSNGLVDVFSLMSIGHFDDVNVIEALYRRGDGNGAGGNQYLVCALRDGLKNCTPWSGPNLRPYAIGADQFGDAIWGVTYKKGTTVNWPSTGTLIGDFLGIGRLQILWYCNDPTQPEGKGWQLYAPNTTGQVDRLVQVVNGMGNTASVEYQPMSNSSVYTPSGVATYPLQNVKPVGRMLVSALHQDGGASGVQTTSYRYQGLTTDVTGRGEQGFQQIATVNPQGTTLTTQYAQGFPYTGMELGRTMTSSTGVMLEQTVSALATVNNTISGGGFTTSTGAYPYVPILGNNTAIYPYVQNSKQKGHQDLNDTPLPLTMTQIGNSTTPGIDSYGNVTLSTTTTQDQANPSNIFSTTVVNTYTYLGAPWTNSIYLINELTQSGVTKAAPGLNGTVNTITHTTAYGYDGNGLPQTVTAEPYNSAINVVTTCSRDAFGNIIQMQQSWPSTALAAATLPSVAAAIAAAEQSPRTIYTAQYDANGRFPVRVANALGNAATPSGQYMTFGYDPASGATSSLTDTNGLITTWSVDGFGRVTKELDADGTETDYYRKQCNDACASIEYPIGAGGQPANSLETPAMVMIVDHVQTGAVNGIAAGTRIAIPSLAFGDTAGHLLRDQTFGFDGTEINSDYFYDQYARLYQAYQPTFFGNTALLAIAKTYDELNRVTGVSKLNDTGTTSTTIQYNVGGLNKIVKKTTGTTKSKVYDALGQMRQSIDAAGNTISYVRDAFGNLLTTIDPNNNQINITYDNLGRKTDLIDPDLGWTHYVIDPRGLVLQQITPNERAANKVTSNQYDALDRLIARYEPDLESHWSYDTAANSAATCASTYSCGKMVEAYTGSSTAPDYDRKQTFYNTGLSKGLPKTTTSTLWDGSYTNTIAYDQWGRVSSTTQQRVSSSNTIAKTYDMLYNGNGYLAQIVRDASSTGSTASQVLWQANQADALLHTLNASLGNGLQVARSYFQNGALQEDDLDSATVGNAPVMTQSYLYDARGNVSQRAQTWGNQTLTEGFTNDVLDRLTSSSINGVAQQYNYDATGLSNLIGKTGVGTGVAGSYHYAGSNTCSAQVGPHAVTSIDGVVGNFCYDTDGNMLSDPWRKTSWTSFDMPNTINTPANIVLGQGGSSFVYGPEHQRTIQYQGNTTIVYADGMESDTVNGSTTLKTHWPMGLGVEIDTIGSGGSTGASALYWTHTDRVDSVIGMTDINGVLQGMSYDAWGMRRNLNGMTLPTTDNKGFTGQEMLDQLNLVHMNGRVYDPYVGRFISVDPLIQDPMASQSLNRYAYVWNNPTNGTDPTGFDDETKTDGGGGDDYGGGDTSYSGDRQILPTVIIVGRRKPPKGTGDDTPDPEAGGGTLRIPATLAAVGATSWKTFEAASAQRLVNSGYTVARHVRVTWEGAKGAYSVMDAVGVKDANIVLLEAKDGLTSKLSSAQKALFDAAFKSKALMIENAGVAEQLSLKAGQSLAEQGTVYVSVDASVLGARSLGEVGRSAARAAQGGFLDPELLIGGVVRGALWTFLLQSNQLGGCSNGRCSDMYYGPNK
ncbi:MAG: Ig-like domain repeat protein [Burkholderiaceae bacterium]|nr:Ig-like domain repeat protein [Burkholderiaceae bacterium]